MKKPLYILKIGGKVLSDPAQCNSLLQAFSQLDAAKILVHGGGKTGTEIAEKLGVEAKMIDGRRITDEAMLEVAMMVYGGLMNKGVVAQLQSLGTNALGLTGADLDVITSIKRPVKEIDYGFAGDIVKVNDQQLFNLLEAGILPVMAPLTHDGKGQMLNTNADTIASTVARSMAAHFEVHLIYSFEMSGVLKDPKDQDSLIPLLDIESYERYKEEGVIVGGMIPKLDNAFSALASGVHRVYICHASAIAGLNTNTFRGTQIFLS
ncbi:MAG: acetylglutamate kinase [Bacteroidota bacterium]